MKNTTKKPATKKTATKSNTPKTAAPKATAKKPAAKSLPATKKAAPVDIVAHKRNEELKAQAVKLKLAGKSLKIIADTIGAPQSSVWRWTHAMKIAA